MDTKTKIITLAFFAVTAGAFAFTRTPNNPPSDLRDAVGEETAADQLMRKLGAGPLDPAAVPVATPAPVPAQDIVFKPGETLKLSPSQMAILTKLARHVYDNKPFGLKEGVVTRHEFDIAGSTFTDDGFRLWESIRMVIADVKGADVFRIRPDGVMTMVGAAAMFDKKTKDKMDKEVSFWVAYETKREQRETKTNPYPYHGRE